MYNVLPYWQGQRVCDALLKKITYKGTSSVAYHVIC
jgi:hypothetical protein